MIIWKLPENLFLSFTHTRISDASDAFFSEESIATLVNIASLDRPEDGIKSLPRLIAESINRCVIPLLASHATNASKQCACVHGFTAAGVAVRLPLELHGCPLW